MIDESAEPDIVFVETRLDRAELRRLVERHFEDMVKPARGNRSMLVEDEGVRRRVRDITASGLLAPESRPSLQRAYERVLRLVDLTVAAQPKRTLRRELLRWRDLVAALYVAPEGQPAAHREAFRCLLRFTPAASRQIAHVLP